MRRMDSLNDKIVGSVNNNKESDTVVVEVVEVVEEESFVLVDTPPTTNHHHHHDSESTVQAAKTTEVIEDDDEYLLVTPREEQQVNVVAAAAQDVPKEVFVVIEKNESFFNKLGAWWETVSAVRLLMLVVAVGLLSLLATSSSSSTTTTSSSPTITVVLDYHEPPSFEPSIARKQISQVVVSESVSSSSNSDQPEPQPTKYLPGPVPTTTTTGPVIVRPSTMLVVHPPLARPAIRMSSQKPKEPAAAPNNFEYGGHRDMASQPRSPAIARSSDSMINLDLVPFPMQATRTTTTTTTTTTTATITPEQVEQTKDAVQQEASPNPGRVIVRPPASLIAHPFPRPIVALDNYSPALSVIQKEMPTVKKNVEEEKEEEDDATTCTTPDLPWSARSIIVRPPTFITSSHRHTTTAKTAEELFLVKNHVEEINNATTCTSTTTFTAVMENEHNSKSSNKWFTRRIQQALSGESIERSHRVSFHGDHDKVVSFEDDFDYTKHYNNNNNNNSTNLVLHQQYNWPPLRDWKQVFFEHSHALIHVRRAWKRWCELFLKQQQERRMYHHQNDDDGDDDSDSIVKAFIACHAMLKDLVPVDRKGNGYSSTENRKHVLPKQGESSPPPPPMHLLKSLEQLLRTGKAYPADAEDETYLTGVVASGSKGRGQRVSSAVAVTSA